MLWNKKDRINLSKYYQSDEKSWRTGKHFCEKLIVLDIDKPMQVNVYLAMISAKYKR